MRDNLCSAGIQDGAGEGWTAGRELAESVWYRYVNKKKNDEKGWVFQSGQ